MNLQKVILVTRREYIYNFLRPSFLFAAFGIPLFIFGLMYLIFNVIISSETNLEAWQQVAIVDPAAILDPTTFENPDLNPDGFVYLMDETVARQRLDDGDLDGYFVLTADYIYTGEVEFYAERGLPVALQENFDTFLQNTFTARAPLSQVYVESDIVFYDIGRQDRISETELFGRLGVPYIFVFVYFIATATTAQFMMGSVVEEKENRLMEILATSVRPSELLTGKTGGLFLLALTQIVVWGIGATLVALTIEDAREFMQGVNLGITDIILLITIFVINFLMFSVLMIGIGAALNAETESRQVAGMITTLMLTPVIFASFILEAPDSGFSVALTLFPFTAASTLVLRYAISTVPAWQVALSFGLQIATTALILWVATKIFRLGMLMYGKSLSPKLLWEMLRTPDHLPAAPTQQENPHA